MKSLRTKMMLMKVKKRSGNEGASGENDSPYR
jgi:hypothetical protein